VRTVRIENMSSTELESRLARGDRIVVFDYCISLVAVTLRRRSSVYFIGSGKKSFTRGLPYTVLSLLLGWWGLPWGVIYTPQVVLTNFSGGCDITEEVRTQLDQSKESLPS
jgi:hypothetical protein